MASDPRRAQRQRDLYEAVRPIRGAAEARAADVEFSRELSREVAVVHHNVYRLEQEITNLSAIPAVNKTPNQLSAEDRKKLAGRIGLFFNSLHRELLSMQKQDSQHLRALFKISPVYERRFVDLINKRVRAIAEVRAASNYWVDLSGTGAFPIVHTINGLRTFNNRRILWPFEHLKQEEIIILSELEHMRGLPILI